MCKVCMKDPCHPRCPNYSSSKSKIYCSACGQKIETGEDFLENICGDTIHFECVQGIRGLLEFLGYQIKTMEDLYDE